MGLQQAEPAINGSVVEVTVPGAALCCRRPMAHLVGVIQVGI